MAVTAPIVATLLVLLAPVIGSFIGVLADRLPRGESVVWPGSRCRDCGTRLGPRDLVPVLSYVVLRGRCRSCGAALPPWLLHTEIAATGLAGLAVIAAPDPGGMVWTALVLWLLLALALCDLLWFRLPDPLTGALLALALGRAAVAGDLAAALAGAVIGAGSFWLLRAGYRRVRGREGMGLGDVKLMAGLGALTGPWDLPLMVLLAALAALGAALAGEWTGQGAGLRGARPLPFGAALAAAGGAVWLIRLAG
ncbi:hypothetical protein ATO6_23690 [Oceanicola sp. 22II-s10i]|uniref:prepilin peptidase n=1 Tax=Oceanicola sp. 22II-s10i TaxID=1317116 RepID=UPI000B525359|nr:A24 family peptidase [Oceanicola sp. 22II-s10i]OWU81687.1 hypothetical protein ATO6_23690 [Oceanicola sp. 22II-s10i]